MAFYENALDWLQEGSMADAPLSIDRILVGKSKRLDIPLQSDYQIGKTGKLLEALGKRLQTISQFRDADERTRLLECAWAVQATREALKTKRERGKGE